MKKLNIIYKRGNRIILQREDDKRRKKTVTVVMHDSMQGILAVDSKGEYCWYRERSSKEHGWPGPYWICKEKIVKKRKKRS